MPGTDEARQGWFRELLLEEKRRLWEEVRGELFDKLGEELHTQYEVPCDIGDQGILDLLDDIGLAVVDIRRQQLTQLEEALLKLEAVRYGLCEDCGDKIPDERLRVAPYAPCCVACQEKREGGHKTGLTL